MTTLQVCKCATQNAEVFDYMYCNSADIDTSTGIYNIKVYNPTTHKFFIATLVNVYWIAKGYIGCSAKVRNFMRVALGTQLQITQWTGTDQYILDTVTCGLHIVEVDANDTVTATL